MQNLLDNTRRMNRMLLKTAGHSVDFNEMAQALSDLLSANVYIASRRGRILGSALVEGFDCGIMVDEIVPEGSFPQDYNQRLLKLDETTANITQEGRGCVFKKGEKCLYGEKVTTIIPINGGGGERLGTLILARFNERFDDKDLVLCEYGAAIVGMEILRSKSDELEDEARKRAAVQVAIGTLSYSELEAVQHIFDELAGTEGLLVASKIADRVGITRSVIVNALRKFESAGVIESRSLGMKGTHIKVLNDRLVPELRKLR